jgi:hypothetical protein
MTLVLNFRRSPYQGKENHGTSYATTPGLCRGITGEIFLDKKINVTVHYGRTGTGLNLKN